MILKKRNTLTRKPVDLSEAIQQTPLPAQTLATFKPSCFSQNQMLGQSISHATLIDLPQIQTQRFSECSVDHDLTQLKQATETNNRKFIQFKEQLSKQQQPPLLEVLENGDMQQDQPQQRAVEAVMRALYQRRCRMEELVQRRQALQLEHKRLQHELDSKKTAILKSCKRLRQE